MRDDEKAFFIVTLRALQPHLGHVVVVGAWAHRLFRLHSLATTPAFHPLMTDDADVAVPAVLPDTEETIAKRLDEYDFEEHLSGGGEIPRIQYLRGNMVLEFIAPLTGAPRDRQGMPKDTLSVCGIIAPRLRYVELLLYEPWTPVLDEQSGFAGADDLTPRVANPVSYLAQKVLSIPRRKKPAKKSKDALYVHDTLLTFASTLDQLRPQADRVASQLPKPTRKELRRLCRAIFEDRSVLAGAAEIAKATGRASPPPPERIAAVCTRGLASLFG